MRKRAYVGIGTLLAFVGALGLIETVGADPDGSQRLRGLGGRTFFVEVYDVFADEYFDNCYTFNADGTWIDPVFPEIGNWVQHSVGAKTSYSAEAYEDDYFLGFPLLLVQEGDVTPARGRGVLQLKAYSQAIFFFGASELVIGEFESVGYEVDSCSV
jgi:hypothetical protein